MSLRNQILNEARGLVDSGLATVVSTIERERLRREAEPEVWYRFHARMAEALPKWRRLAIAWHRARARRYDAMRHAQLKDICTAAAERQTNLI